MMTYDEFREQNIREHGYRPENSILEDWSRYFRDNAAIGDGATLCYWSDKEAYTIIKRTRATLTLQRDNATLEKSFKPEFIPGGFCGTVVNQDEQTYTYTRNPEGVVIIAHWSDKNNGFYYNGLRIIPGRHEFYDYNF